MDDLKHQRRRLRQRSSSKQRLLPLEVTTRGSPSSFRHLFNHTPCGNSYSRSLSLLPPLGLDRKRVSEGRCIGLKRPQIEAPSITRLVKFLSLRGRSSQRHSQHLNTAIRALTPLEHNSPWKTRMSDNRCHSECKLGDVGHEVTFITLDLDPRSSQAQRRRTRRLDRLPFVYLPKMSQLQRFTEVPAPTVQADDTPVRKSVDSLDSSPSKHRRKAYNSRPLLFSPSKKAIKQPEITSVGPWLSEN